MTPARPRFLALLASAAVVAALLVMPAAAGAAGGGDSASGHGLQFGQQIDFSARSTNTGTDARGRIRVTLTGVDPNDVYTAEVTCMRVAGATATTFATAVISGRIVDQPPGQPFQSILVFATDSGKFSNAPDGLTASRSTAPSPPESGCPAPIVAPALAEGEVTINNTLP